jgi:hypothetical protein
VEGSKRKGEMTHDIEAILDEFDFARVAKCMEFIGWKYFDGQPDAAHLRKIARDLLEAVAKDGTRMARTGGFVAVKDGDGDNDYLSIEFVLAFSNDEK